MVDFGEIARTLFTWEMFFVITASATYGLVLGAIPGLTALMATALMVPIIMFMDTVPALAAIITASAMAIFSGDIPAALMRMPGTPASAAYTDDAYGLTQRGKAGLSLGAGLVSSAIAGLLSAVVLVLAAPSLARVALNFSSVEYFWLAALGLSCAVVVAGPSLVKGLCALFLGLAMSTIGMDPVGGIPRFTFGETNLMGGLGLVPVLIGLFAVSELLRGTLRPVGEARVTTIGPVLKGMGPHMWRHRNSLANGSVIGVIVGILPGAGSDIAAWVAYAVSRRFSKLGRRDDDTGAVDRIMAAGASNNSSLGGAYIPATVFGIPGDAITAIVISVMVLKGVNPGPTIFVLNPSMIYSIFAVFFIANLVMLPLGVLAIRGFGLLLKIPPHFIAPVILVACILGAFSVENTMFAVGVVAATAVLGYMMEINGVPVAPAVLGLILGPLIEQTFTVSMIKSHGDLWVFFDRPVGGTIGAVTLVIWVLMAFFAVRQSRRARGMTYDEAENPAS